jgi:hypothetical protein
MIMVFLAVYFVSIAVFLWWLVKCDCGEDTWLDP